MSMTIVNFENRNHFLDFGSRVDINLSLGNLPTEMQRRKSLDKTMGLAEEN